MEHMDSNSKIQQMHAWYIFGCFIEIIVDIVFYVAWFNCGEIVHTLTHVDKIWQGKFAVYFVGGLFVERLDVYEYFAGVVVFLAELGGQKIDEVAAYSWVLEGVFELRVERYWDLWVAWEEGHCNSEVVDPDLAVILFHRYVVGCVLAARDLSVFGLLEG